MILEENIKKCQNCKNIIKPNPQIYGDIIKAKVVFISEEPTEKASGNDFYKYYLGRSNQIFHSDWMHAMGITINWLKQKPYITHVYKCCSAKKNRCEKCKAWLYKEKELFKNKIIVTFGETALCGIIERPYRRNEFKKYIVEYNKFPELEELKSKIIPIIHPSWRNKDFIERNQNRIYWILKQINKKIKRAR